MLSTGSNHSVAMRKCCLFCPCSHLSNRSVRDGLFTSVLMKSVSCHSSLRTGGDQYCLLGLNGSELGATLHESFLNPG